MEDLLLTSVVDNTDGSDPVFSRSLYMRQPTPSSLLHQHIVVCCNTPHTCLSNQVGTPTVTPLSRFHSASADSSGVVVHSLVKVNETYLLSIVSQAIVHCLITSSNCFCIQSLSVLSACASVHGASLLPLLSVYLSRLKESNERLKADVEELKASLKE